MSYETRAIARVVMSLLRKRYDMIAIVIFNCAEGTS